MTRPRNDVHGGVGTGVHAKFHQFRRDARASLDYAKGDDDRSHASPVRKYDEQLERGQWGVAGVPTHATCTRCARMRAGVWDGFAAESKQ